MAKNTKTGRESSNDQGIPLCTEGLKALNPKLGDLYVQFNKGTRSEDKKAVSSYSIKAGNCKANNVGWIIRGWLSLKTEFVNRNPNLHVYLIGEINKVLNEDLRDWLCWKVAIQGRTKKKSGSGYEGHLHFRDDAAALCFLSKFYRLHSCHGNPPDKKKEIENPCK